MESHCGTLSIHSKHCNWYIISKTAFKPLFDAHSTLFYAVSENMIGVIVDNCNHLVPHYLLEILFFFQQQRNRMHRYTISALLNLFRHLIQMGMNPVQTGFLIKICNLFKRKTDQLRQLHPNAQL